MAERRPRGAASSAAIRCPPTAHLSIVVKAFNDCVRLIAAIVDAGSSGGPGSGMRRRRITSAATA